MEPEKNSPRSISEDDLNLLEGIYTGAMEPDEIDSEHQILEEIGNLEERYRTLREIARGGVKTIYLAEDRATGRELAMAVRQHYSDDRDSEVFLREARITASLQHPNIIPIYDIGTDRENRAFFTMKYIEGESLCDALAQRQQADHQLTLSERVEIFNKICDAVAFAHHHGVLHLDLKPANIRVSGYGEVILCDWGLAEIMDCQCEDPHLLRYSYDMAERRAQSLNGTIQGTPGYMAPEQLELGGKKDQRTDIYALGAILYELVTLRSATEIDDPDNMSDSPWNAGAHTGGISPLNADAETVDPSLYAIAVKARSKDKEDRYQSCDDLLNELRVYRSGYATSAEDAAFLRQLLLFYKRHATLINAAAAITLIVVATFGVSFMSISRSERDALAAKEKLEEEKTERLKLGKETAPRYLVEAYALFAKTELDAALEQTQAAIVLDPVNTEARNLAGAIYFLLGKHGQAGKQLRTANSELFRQIRAANTAFSNASLKLAAKQKEILSLIRYCTAQNEEPLAFSILLNLLKHDMVEVRRFCARDMPLLPENCLRVLQIISTSDDREMRSIVLKRALKSMSSNTDWRYRRLPAELGAKLSTSKEMREKFIRMIPANLALGQPITSYGGETRSVEHAVDGQRFTGEVWSADPLPAYCTIDLGKVHNVSKFKLYFVFIPPSYYQYLVEVSEDGNVFQTVVDQSKNTTLNSKSPSVHKIKPTAARYVRLRITHNSSSPVIHVREVQVFE